MDNKIIDIAIERLIESPFNPRKQFLALDELAADIKSQGRVLQPLLVRPALGDRGKLNENNDRFEIVFGHRRFRAAEMAGLATVPCMLRAMTDQDAKRAQISENLQRKDVHALEEAEGFRALLDADEKLTADMLAEQFGKSRSYVYGRLKLLQACPEIRTACLEGEIIPDVALIIARLRTEKLQQKALGYIKGKFLDLKDGGKETYRRLKSLLEEHFATNLKTAIFDPTDALLVKDAGACGDCPKRTGNAPEFSDIAEQPEEKRFSTYTGGTDVCTDPDCFAAKKKAHLAAEAMALEDKGRTVVDGNRARAAIGADGKVKGSFIALKDVKAELKKVKGAKVETVVIQDPRSGKTVEAVKVADLVSAGVDLNDKKKREANEAQDNYAKEQAARKQREKDAATATAAYVELLGRVRESLAAATRSAFDLSLVATTTLSGVGYNDREPLALLWGCKSFEGLQKKVGSLAVADLTQLMIDCALVRGITQKSYEQNTPANLLAAAKHYGVSTKAPDAKPATPAPAARAPKGAKGKAVKACKYRDPNNGQTWTGRGLMPQWVKAAIEQGKTLADLEVKAVGVAATDGAATPAPAARAPKGAEGKAPKKSAAGASAVKADPAIAGKGKSKGKEQTDEAGSAGAQIDLVDAVAAAEKQDKEQTDEAGSAGVQADLVNAAAEA